MLPPLAAGQERIWSESGCVIVAHLVQPAAVAYWSALHALHYWKMTEHIPSVTFVQPKHRKRSLKRMRFRFVTVKEARQYAEEYDDYDKDRARIIRPIYWANNPCSK